MSTDTQDVGVLLHRPKQLQEQLALLRRVPVARKVAHEPSRPFYADQLLDVKPGFFHLQLQLIGMVKESRCEISRVVGRIAVLTALQIFPENTDKSGIRHQIARES